MNRRLVSTAARLPSIAPSTIPNFPPKESFISEKDAFVKDKFDPQNWAALQPAPSTALSAFAHRIGLASLFTSTDLIRQACTHPSFLSLFRQHYPTKPEPATNANLAVLGNSLMGLFAAEYIHIKYPYLPTRVMKAAVTAYVGPFTCESVAREMGATPLLRWHRIPATESSQSVLHADALASIPRSITGLLYRDTSLTTTKDFVHSYFLSRQIDLRGMLKFYNPKKSLLDVVRKYKREIPRSRLLKETGRFSNSPMFVVGIFSGEDQLGEGFGSSLQMAEFRAAEDALHRLYLTQTPEESIQLPSSTFVSGSYPKSSNYTAPELAPDDILWSSSDKFGPRRKVPM